jgi:dienelactone hydrolase
MYNKVETYNSEPANPTKTAVLILLDIFGVNINSKLLADDFASNGFLTLIPDLFPGDQVDFGDLMSGKIELSQYIRFMVFVSFQSSRTFYKSYLAFTAICSDLSHGAICLCTQTG